MIDIPLPVYMPSNEPYLGRTSVYHFDQVIVSTLEINGKAAAYTHTHKNKLTDLQVAASQIIPQGVNIALTIRELVRQGYLFGALVLIRPLMERTATISYLLNHQGAIEIWKKGWLYKGKDRRPNLNEMLRIMSGKDAALFTRAKEMAQTLHHIIHGDPVGSQFNLVTLNDGNLGYSVGKSIDDPVTCDFICFESYCYLLILQAMIQAIFPDAFSG